VSQDNRPGAGPDDAGPGGVGPQGPQRGPGALDASMTLLNEVIRKPLDPGYRLAAERKALQGSPPPAAPRVAVILLCAMGLGLGTTAAAMSLRAPEPSGMAARDLLEEQIRERTADVDVLREHAHALGAEIDQLHASALAASDSRLVEQLEGDALASGAVGVVGPGIRITFTDPPPDDGVPADPLASLQDRDLQIVVNGLWQAGAEAVAVNGQRLSATSSIRSAGGAILVDLVPIIGPYVVEAVGDPQGLQTDLARSASGFWMTDLRRYDIDVDVSSQRELRLPAATRAALRSATVPPGTSLVTGGHVAGSSPTAYGRSGRT